MHSSNDSQKARKPLAWALLATLLVGPALAPFGAAATPPTETSGPVPLALPSLESFKDTRYLIVTAAAHGSIMQPIADWKTDKGLPAKVALIEDVRASYAGRDDAEKLHNFLQDVYFNATGGRLKYVLLGGGAGLLPVRYLHTEGNVITWYTHNDVFSDVYYAGLDRNWDADGDGIYGEYGEEDWDANVYVGRLVFNDAAQAAITRDNLLSYERSPLQGAWMAKALAFASVMDPPNNVPVGDPPQANAYDFFEDNAIRSVWNTQPYIPSGMSLQILADYYELYGGNYTPGEDRLSNASMVAALSGGASVVMSVTHGWVPSGKGVPEYTGFDGVSYSWGEGLTYQSAPGLSNFGQLSFGYFSSCLIGNFSQTSLPNLARFTVLDNHGFVAMILPTDGSLRGEDDYPRFREGNWWQSENYWKNFFTGSDPFRPGPALYQGIRDYDAHIRAIGRDETWGGYRTQKAVYNLIGDPEVPIWTGVALDFNAALPASLYTAEQHFRATFRDEFGRPAAGATVALSGLGVYAVATADAQGRVDVVIHPQSTGNLKVTATLHNMIPLQAVVPVTTAPADLSIEPQYVALPSPILRTNEQVSIAFSVHNVGQLPSTPTDARVYATPPGGVPQLIAGSIALAALGPGEEAVGTFSWTPAEEGVHGLRIVVDPSGLVAEFDELNNEVDLPIPVSSVDLAIDPASVSLNPPGQVAPGSLVRVSGAVGVTGLLPRGYLIGYEVLGPDGALLWSGNLEASTSLTQFAFDLVIGGTGDFTLRIKADSEGVVLEFNETNNQVDVPVRSGAGPSIYTLPPLSLDEDAGRAVVIQNLALFVVDPDTPFENLLFSVGSSAPELRLWVQGRELIGMPAPDWNGNANVALSVSDGTYTATAATTIVVEPVADAPVAELPAVFEGQVGEPVVFQISARDPDGDTLTFASQSDGVPVVASTGVVAFVAPDSLVGTTGLRFTVSDGRFTVTVRTTLIVLPADEAPALLPAGPLIVHEGEAARWTILAHDAEGEPLTFSTNSTRVDVHADGTAALSAGQSRALGPGTHVIPVAVTDGIHTTTGQFVVIVEEAPTAPSRDPYGTQTAVFGTTVALLALAAAGLGITLGRARSARRR